MTLLCYIGLRAGTRLLLLGTVLPWSTPARAADEACAACHPKEAREYRNTGMGRSISRAAGGHSGSFTHAKSGTFFSVRATAGGQAHKLRRGGLETERPIAYTIGSGNAAIGYLLRIDDRLYQSPITFYTASGRFGIAPGMEELTDPNFLRPVTADCLWCHAGKPSAVPHSLNRYADPPLAVEAISCERCHGPAAAHLQNPSRDTILNPAELPPALRDSVCEQCHLSGAQRVLNPGRSPGDFEPGMALEEVLTVYITADDENERAFKVVSHSEQIALSRCFRESGRTMWCGACHDPHDDFANTRAGYIRKCTVCHGDLTSAGHGAPGGDCVACHMARRTSRDSGHSAFTDHRISIRPQTSGGPATAWTGPLRAWREPPPALRERNLGIAYARRAETSGSRDDAARASRLLSAAIEQFPGDPDALGGLGMSLLLTGHGRRGLEMLEQAIAAEPDNPLRYPPAAAAQWQLGQDAKAIATLRAAIRADPYYLPSYRMLAYILGANGPPDDLRAVWESYLQHVPQSINARLALRSLPAKSHAR